MKLNDADLIQHTLEGDEHAFSSLVEKYHKQIHALAWQKIGDFHIAQEITQDTFLTAFHKLASLKHHNRLAGWLYVIADRKCKNWQRKNKLTLESLEDIDPMEIEEVYYSEYMTHQREKATEKKRRAIVQKLLSKLQESERTVVNLYYIAEMTCEDIGKFLGVSPNTVRSRLHRARNRLRKEESVLKENLSSFQLPTQFTENIMEKIMNTKPITPSSTNPLIPLAFSAASAIIAVLLIGIGAKNLYSFQKPFSFNAQSEQLIEITEAKLVSEVPTKPRLQTLKGKPDAISENNGIDQKQDTTLFAAGQSEGNQDTETQQQWVRAKGPEGGMVTSLFVSTQRGLYAGTVSDLYKLTDDGSNWDLIGTNLPFYGIWKIHERNDAFYAASHNKVFVSLDKGRTWRSLGDRPEGQLVGMTITDKAFYLALPKDVYQSIDEGRSWTILNNGLKERKIRAITAIENSVFVGTDEGLFELSSGKWQPLSIDGKVSNVQALTNDGRRLYVAVGKDEKNRLIAQFKSFMTTAKPDLTLYRTTDLGETWTPITPKLEKTEKQGRVSYTLSGNSEKETHSSIRIVAQQDILMVIDRNGSYYSNDAGENWSTLTNSFSDLNVLPVVAIRDEKTIYVGTNDGIHLSTDAGQTWNQMNSGIVNRSIIDLVNSDDALYANIGNEIFISSDRGESWEPVLGQIAGIDGMVESNGKIYAKSSMNLVPRLYHVSEKDKRVFQIHEIPKLKALNFDELMSEKINNALLENVEEEAKDTLQAEKKIDPKQINTEGFNEKYKKIVQEGIDDMGQLLFGDFAVEDQTYYLEFKQQLLRWKPGETEWFKTGLLDESPVDVSGTLAHTYHSNEFKIATSGKQVYVGMRNGHLMFSLDEGDIWNDVSVKLPFSVERFNDIIFAEETVYVATDKGVVKSRNGLDWKILMNAAGEPLVMNRLSNSGTKVFGESERVIYQINNDSDKWKKTTEKIPYQVSCFDVVDNTIYVGTFGSGVLRYTLDD